MSRRPTTQDRRPKIRRASTRSGWASLGLRVLLALALIGVAIAGHWFDRDGLRDNIDGDISFTDVLYFTMITVTTVGYGDIVPVTPQARMFDTFVVTPIRLFVWLIFLGTAYEFLLKHIWENWRMSRIQDRLRGHVIVAGFGTSGAEAVRELIRRGVAPVRRSLSSTPGPPRSKRQAPAASRCSKATRPATRPSRRSRSTGRAAWRWPPGATTPRS